MRLPIRFKIIIVLLLVITTVLGMITYTMGKLFHEDKSLYIRDLATVMSRQAGVEARSVLSGYQERLGTFANLIFEADLDQKNKLKLLKNLFQDSVDFISISVFEDGIELATLYDNKALESAGLTTDLFSTIKDRSVQVGEFLDLNQILVENTTLSENLPTLSMHFRSPVSKTSRVVLTANIRLDRLLFMAKRSDVMDTFLMTHEGELLIHSDMSLILNHSQVDWLPDIEELKSGKVSTTTIEYLYKDEPYLGGIARTGFANIIAGTQIPISTAYLGERELLNELLQVSLALLLVSAMIGIAWSRYFTSPIEKLSKAAKIVGQGDFHVKVDKVSKDEFGDLATSFNTMTDELNNREQELKRAQSALVQSEKMSAFGQMSAGIAHEVKNPLAGILGYVQLSKRKMDNDNPIMKNLEIIEKETKRCTNIVMNLMKFARADNTVFDLIDINDIVNESMDIVAHQLAMKSVSIERNLTDDLPKILGKPNQLEQILLNFAINAQQAMEEMEGFEKGLFTVRTRLTENNTIRLEASDTGPGMTEETKKHLFEPFYTTKEAGKGTGLGLSVTYGIIRDHKAVVNIESELGNGSTFIIDFPIPTEAEIEEATRQSEDAKEEKTKSDSNNREMKKPISEQDDHFKTNKPKTSIDTNAVKETSDTKTTGKIEKTAAVLEVQQDIQTETDSMQDRSDTQSEQVGDSTQPSEPEIANASQEVIQEAIKQTPHQRPVVETPEIAVNAEKIEQIARNEDPDTSIIETRKVSEDISIKQDSPEDAQPELEQNSDTSITRPVVAEQLDTNQSPVSEPSETSPEEKRPDESTATVVAPSPVASEESRETPAPPTVSPAKTPIPPDEPASKESRPAEYEPDKSTVTHSIDTELDRSTRRTTVTPIRADIETPSLDTNTTKPPSNSDIPVEDNQVSNENLALPLAHRSDAREGIDIYLPIDAVKNVPDGYTVSVNIEVKPARSDVQEPLQTDCDEDISCNAKEENTELKLIPKTIRIVRAGH